MSIGLGDIIEVAAVHLFLNTDEIINVWHFKAAVASTGGFSEEDTDIGAMMDELYTIIEDEMSSGVSVGEIRWRNITDNTPTRYIAWPGPHTGGESATTSLPPGLSPLITLRTGQLNVTGRKFLPPFTEAQQTGGVWDPGALSVMDGVGDWLMSAYNGVESGVQFAPAVYSRTLGNSYPIISYKSQRIPAYQRRRRQGRGS